MLAAVLMPAVASATTYAVDAEHTNDGFSVRHLFTSVEGKFRTFAGEIVYDPAAPEKTSVTGTIDVSSIDTNVKQRDDHLRGPDFFDVAKFPKIAFKSTGVSDVDTTKNTGKLQGDLTIHGVTKPVVLDVQFLGAATDPWGNKKAGFTASTTINRKDFGLGWNKTLETGGVLVGEDVTIRINAEGNVQE
jgi:polyisoprenoid-binding protein YceI